MILQIYTIIHTLISLVAIFTLEGNVWRICHLLSVFLATG
jgi:hypothetical protein